MANQADIAQELLDQQPYLTQLLYVLITDQHLHNRGAWKLLKLVSVCMLVGAFLGYIIFGNKFVGATAASLLAIIFGDTTSDEVFSLVSGIKLLPVTQHFEVEERVVELVGSGSLVALRNYVKVPNQYSQLAHLLRSYCPENPRELSTIWIVPVVFAVCLGSSVFSIEQF